MSVIVLCYTYRHIETYIQTHSMNGRVYFVEMCHYGEIMTDILFENSCTYDMIFERLYF